MEAALLAMATMLRVAQKNLGVPGFPTPRIIYVYPPNSPRCHAERSEVPCAGTYSISETMQRPKRLPMLWMWHKCGIGYLLQTSKHHSLGSKKPNVGNIYRFWGPM